MSLFNRPAIGLAALIFCLGILLGFVTYYLRILPTQDYEILTEPDLKEHVITRTDEGFSPATITIRKDDVITFVSAVEKPYWPASNLHPTHSLYATFDPKYPLAPAEHWSFVFDTPGVWKYHDHLDPQKTGVITVLDEKGKAVRVPASCEKLEGSEKLQCFDQTLETYLRDEGIEAAFVYFKKIYASDPEVPMHCHSWTHRLGEVEYGFYKEGKDVSLRPEATFCSYGYFHGFINAMVEDTQSLQSAQQFCDEAVKENGEELRGMLSNCVHGIGHSIATLMLESQENWGDERTVIERGSRECEKLYTDLRNVCFDGMLHELYSSMKHSDYGMDVLEYEKSNDIFYYCHDLSGLLAESCFHESVTLWWFFLGEDKVAAMEYVLSHIPDLLLQAPRVIHTFARSFIEREIATNSFQDSVDACSKTPAFLFETCLQGLASGFVTHGEPGKMHEAGFRFCRDYYEGENRSLCFHLMVHELFWNYSDTQLKDACEQLSKEERPQLCR